MKLSPRNALAAAIALVSQSAFAADTYLNVFLEEAPMLGVEVVLDGTALGTTDNSGAATAEISSGNHKVELFQAGYLLTSVDYETSENEDAEIRVTFSEAGDEPQIKVSLFDAGDTANGRLGGVITDVAGAAIAGAVITNTDGEELAQSGSDGAYEIELPRGSYSLQVKAPGYIPVSVNDIRVLANLGTSASVKLTAIPVDKPSVFVPNIQMPVEEVLTVGTYKPTESALGLERFSSNVVDALDIEQLARFGDSNVAVALTRLVGVSVTGGKYANVRGLDGRYISSTLNGFLMPSTDPMRRDVQLDLFPSNILSGIEVQKSYSPDLLGTTTGGSLKISTKGLPEERTFKVKMKVGGNSEITGNEIATHEGSNGDAIGIDLGLRSLSDSVLDATGGTALRGSLSIGDNEGDIPAIEGAAYAVTFEDDYNIKAKEANPEFGLALSYGDISDEGLFGFYGALSYDYDTDARIDAELTNPFAAVGSYDRSQESYSVNGYFVTGSQFRAEDEILSKTMVLRESEQTTRRESSVDKEDNEKDTFILQWVERQFASQQFIGKHVFDFGTNAHQFDWRIGFSNTDRYEPDRRSYQYLSGFLLLLDMERRWSELSEDSVDFSADYTLPFDIGNSIHSEIKVGGVVSEKDRTVDLYRFGWKAGSAAEIDDRFITIDQNLEEVFGYINFVRDVYQLAPNSTVTDSYTSEENIDAFYVNTTTEIAGGWTVGLGARQEDFTQVLSYPNSPENENELVSSEVLPAFTLTYAPSDEWQFRFGSSSTVSYPGLIERSESKSFDPNTDRQITGNPNLEVSTIDNLDFRIEYYFTDERSISLAFFNKEIDSPVERALPDGSGSATDGITFRNAEAASINGIEIDGSVNLFETSNWLGFVSGNVTFIESEVELDERSIQLGDLNGRELQGQSPVLANLQFGFDNFPTEQKFTLLVNYFDDRIYNINRGSSVGSELEVGRMLVNANYEKLFGENFSLKAQLKNILNEDIQYSINDIVVESYKEGIGFSLDISYEF